MAEQIGGVEFEVEVNADGTIKATDTLIAKNKTLEAAFEKVEESIKGNTGAYRKLSPKLEQIEKEYSSITNSLRNVISREISLGNTIDKNNRVIDKNGNEVREATQALQAYSAQAAKLQGNINATNAAVMRMTSSVKGSGGAMGNAGHMAGQLGFQIQDVAVQAQMGTSAFTILAQQGSQIASVFGPGGAVVGAVIAISSALVGAFIPSLIDAGDSVEEQMDRITEKLNETGSNAKLISQVEFGKLRTEFQKIVGETATLNLASKTTANGFAKLGFEVLKFFKSDDENEVTEKMNKLDEAIKNFLTSSAEVPESTDDQNESIGQLVKSLEAHQYALSNSELNTRLWAAAQQTGAETIDNLDPKVRQLIESNYALEQSQKADAEAAREQSRAQRELDRTLDQIFRNTETRRAQEAAAAAKDLEDKKARFEQIAELNRTFEMSDVERMREQFDNERIAVADHHAAMLEQKTLNADEIKALEQRTADELLKINERYIKSKEALDKASEQSRVRGLSGFFGDLSSLMNTESRKLFEIGKAAAIAEIAINAPVKAETAGKWGMKLGGPPLAAAFEIASYAASAVNAARVASTSFGSAGVGQSYAGGQVATNTAPVQQQASRNVSISITGDNFGAGGIRSLIEEINEAAGDGVNILTTGG